MDEALLVLNLGTRSRKSIRFKQYFFLKQITAGPRATQINVIRFATAILSWLCIYWMHLIRNYRHVYMNSLSIYIVRNLCPLNYRWCLILIEKNNDSSKTSLQETTIYQGSWLDPIFLSCVAQAKLGWCRF